MSIDNIARLKFGIFNKPLARRYLLMILYVNNHGLIAPAAVSSKGLCARSLDYQQQRLQDELASCCGVSFSFPPRKLRLVAAAAAAAAARLPD